MQQISKSSSFWINFSFCQFNCYRIKIILNRNIIKSTGTLMSEKSEKIFKIRKIKTWTKQEDELIKEMIHNRKRKSWISIIKQMNKKSSLDCIARFKSTCFNRGRWTSQEDEVLLKYYSVLGGNWAAISKLMKIRNWKQVRDRYTNHLDPQISQDVFSPDEDLMIYHLHQIYGNRWSAYIDHLPHRTADKIKNRFNSSIRRKIKLYDKSDVKTEP